MGLDTVELVLWAEKEFALAIPQAKAAQLITVGDLVNYIAQHSPLWQGQPLDNLMQNSPIETHPIYIKLKQVLVERYGVAPQAITPQARFVQDLGLG